MKYKVHLKKRFKLSMLNSSEDYKITWQFAFTLGIRSSSKCHNPKFTTVTVNIMYNTKIPLLTKLLFVRAMKQD